MIVNLKEHQIWTNEYENRIEKSLTVWFWGLLNGFIGNKEGKNMLRRIFFTFIAVKSLNAMGRWSHHPKFFGKTCVFMVSLSNIGVTGRNFALGRRK